VLPKMANVVLIIIAIVMTFLIAVGCFYILVYFSAPEDKNTAIFPKVVTVFGLTLACCNVLLLPLDRANQTTNGGIPMAQLWLASYITLGILILVVVPFAIFYYEAEDPDKSNVSQIVSAMKWCIVIIIVFAIITILLYVFLGVAEVPVTKLSASLGDTQSMLLCLQCTQKTDQTVNYRVSILLYLISMLAFAGMFVFVFFCGIGMAALPMDLINSWRTRPKKIDFKRYAETKIIMGRRASDLLTKAEKLKAKLGRSGRPKNRKQRNEFNRFKANVLLLEEEFTKLERAYGKGIGPRLLEIVWDWLQLVLGVLGGCLTFLWLLHLILYVAVHPPITGFLNDMFEAMDSAFSLFGTVAFGIFAFYLLWCVMKGNFKVGMRIPLIFEIHPMTVGNTYMNSFLFNTLLLMLASITIVDFCTYAFSGYAKLTSIDLIFNVGVRNLEFLKYFYRYYYWGLFVLVFLSTFFLFLFPSDKRAAEKGLLVSELP